ncbi:MAG: amidohydrolase family protein [Phycisphaeraceae bacterium]
MSMHAPSESEPAGAVRSASCFTLVDTDIHHCLAGTSDLLPYLSKYDQVRLKQFGTGGTGDPYAYNGGIHGRRADVVNEGKWVEPGSNISKVVHEHLDPGGFDIGILTGQSVYGASAIADISYAASLCRAFNDWTIEHWLPADRRFRFCMAIGTQDPIAAAREIDRIGDHPQICGVLMPGGTPRPFGQRFYNPIFEACCQHHLTPAIHFFSEGGGINPAPTPAGYPGSYAESRASRFTIYLAHLASLIYEGTFETFPDLKVAMLECGFAWVPSALWRMDSDWKGLRQQTPWVKRLPSEYVIEHVRFNSQPVDEPPRRRDVEQLVTWMHGDQTLMFGSDFPHWDYDDPARTLTELPAPLRQRVMADNAAEVFRLQPLEALA